MPAGNNFHVAKMVKKIFPVYLIYTPSQNEPG
jgi:hypothetical protein